jgi:hypothetical protein
VPDLPIEEIERKLRKIHKAAMVIGDRAREVSLEYSRLNGLLFEVIERLQKIAPADAAKVLTESGANLNELVKPSVLLTFPCEGKIQTFDVTTDLVATYEGLYASMDVMQELRRMLAWVKANPTKKKTAKGMPRFIDSWLSRAQNSQRFQQRQLRISIAEPQERPPYEAWDYQSWDEWRADIRRGMGTEEEKQHALFNVDEMQRKWEAR